eukprot:c19494_g1_i1.p1 GENE.c19494_g1_i1~~c19494_g1_i1.p1  ORF type:complete len:773 (-),score=178.72 c19494_g1_i1:53-2371(-)
MDRNPTSPQVCETELEDKDSSARESPGVEFKDDVYHVQAQPVRRRSPVWFVAVIGLVVVTTLIIVLSVVLTTRASNHGGQETEQVDVPIAVPNALRSIAFAPVLPQTPSKLAISGADNAAEVVDIGFDFLFDGGRFNKAVVSTNGYLTFNLDDVTPHCCAATIPNQALPNRYIAWAMGALDPRRGNMTVETVGSAPKRVFVLTLNRVGTTQSLANLALNVQVVLREDIQCAEVHYGTIGLVLPTLQFSGGVENGAGNGGLSLFSDLNEQQLRNQLQTTAYRYCFADAIPVSPDTTQSPTTSSTRSTTVSVHPSRSSTSTATGSKTTTKSSSASESRTAAVTVSRSLSQTRSNTRSQTRTQSPTPSTSPSPLFALIPLNPLDPVNPTQLQFGNTDDGLALVDIGFAFPFDGSTFEQALLCTNGFMKFDLNDQDAQFSTPNIPDSDTPNNFIAWAFGDLQVLDDGAVFVETVGDAPDRQFVITLVDVDAFDHVDINLNLQVRLQENGCIEWHYMAFTFQEALGNSFTAGVESADGQRGLAMFQQVRDISEFVNKAFRGCFGATLERVSASPTPSPVLPLTDTGVFESIPLAPINFTNAIELVFQDFDDNITLVDIGFDFPFDGSVFSQALVSTNGFLTFDLNDVDAHCCNGPSIPSTTSPNNFIAWAFGDLSLSSASLVRVQTFGDVFVIECSDVTSPNDTTLDFNVQVQLHADGCVELHYGEVSQSDHRDTIFTAGVENVDGTAGAQLFHLAQPDLRRVSHSAFRACFADPIA